MVGDIQGWLLGSVMIMSFFCCSYSTPAMPSLFTPLPSPPHTIPMPISSKKPPWFPCSRP